MNGDAAAPPELRLGWECDRFNCLPEAGGYLDQQYLQMFRITVLMNVYSAYSHYRNAHGAEIHNLSESERRILRELKDTGLIFNANS